MQSVLSFRLRQAAVAAILLLACAAMPAAAFDLFAQHEVTVQFATQDGKPMADAEVRVFAPGHPDRPASTGRTDSDGKFAFAADTDGMWTAEARSGSEIARASMRVGGATARQPISPVWLIGGLLVLLVLAFAYRVMRARSRRGPGSH